MEGEVKMEKDIVRNQERISDHERRIASLECLQTQLTELNRQTAVMLNIIDGLRESFIRVENTMAELDGKIRYYELEPGHKWKKATWLIFTLLATSIVGLVLTIVGMKPL